MIFDLAKELGQSEQYIKDNYTRATIYERRAIDCYDIYVKRKIDEMT